MTTDPVASRIVVVGAGMVAHRFVESMTGRDAPWRITVLGGEPRPPYDRVGLTSFFDGRSPDELLGPWTGRPRSCSVRGRPAGHTT